MKLSLIANLDESDADEIKAQFISSHRLRERVIAILQKDIQVLFDEIKNEDTLAGSPNWATLVASKIAQIKAYEKIISLLEK